MILPSQTLSRRKFLIASGCAALTLPLYGGTGLGANSRVRIAIIGCGGRGTGLAKNSFSKIPNVEIAVLCDPDTRQMDRLEKTLAEAGVDTGRIKKIQDYRKVYERNDIDAVVIASQNHWHTLHAIQALQAGKAVYVEKPVTHNLWEGRQLVAAEKKYGHIIGGGHQNRSDTGPTAGIRYVQEGNLGKMLSVHICCFRNRTSIGKRSEPLVPPATVDYDLWLGPAQDLPMYRERFHYDWHWIWNTGNGDIGNQCPHEIDMARWVLGDGILPRAIQSFGGRFAWDDGGETPNMITAAYTDGGIPCIIEVNDVRISPDRNTTGMRNKMRVGIIVKCEGGELRGGRGGMYAVGEDGETVIKKFPGDSGGGHQKNFIEALRAGDPSLLNSRIADAEKSAAVAHLANISLRTGSVGGEKAVRNWIGDHDVLNAIVDDQAAQLSAWGIDNPDYILGEKLDIDPVSAKVNNLMDPSLFRPAYRKGFEVPELA